MAIMRIFGKNANDDFVFDLCLFYLYGIYVLYIPSAKLTEAVHMKKNFLIVSTLFLLPICGFSLGKPPEGISLILVPAQPAMVQLGKDVAEAGHAILMTYADSTSPDEPFIHIWDGSRWLHVSPEKYRKGDFIRNRASNLLIVGKENVLTAGLIEQGFNWSPEVLHVGSLNVTELINQIGKLYDFNRREWEWFAKRYDLTLEDAGSATEQISWYDSHRASTLPPAERPWAKEKSSTSRMPQTSLSPVMPPVESSDTAGDASENSGTPADSSFQTELEP